MTNKIYFGNFCGSVVAYEENGKFYLTLGKYNEPQTIEISEGFFRAIEKEFKGE